MSLLKSPNHFTLRSEDTLKVLFVCLGNICRSPTGEAILKKIVNTNNQQDQFVIQSAGTGNYHVGERPDPRTLFHGEKRGLVFESRAQQFNPKTHFDYFDFILCMDNNNLKHIQSLDIKNSYQEKINIIMNYAPDAGFKEVPDPYRGGPKDFERVIDLLEIACQNFYNSLKIRDR